MNYRSQVEEFSLGEDAKSRIVAAVGQRAEEAERKRAARPSSAGKRLLAAGLSLALVCAVAAPIAVYASKQKPENWVEIDALTDTVAEGEYNPEGAFGTVVGGHKIYYEAGETFTLSYRIMTGREIVSTEKRENGIEVLSVRFISAETNEEFRTPDNAPWTTYTYEIGMKMSQRKGKLSCGVKFLFEGEEGQEMNFYGYRPAEGEKAYVSPLSQDSAFYRYLDYLLAVKKISGETYGEMLRRYLNDGGVEGN